jgi:hypothetical protein
MAKKEAPAGVAPGTGAGRRSGEPLLCNTEPAENPASNVVPFPRGAPQCEHCGRQVPPASATELRHYYLCTLPRQKAEARERRIAALRERCRQEERERLRKASRTRAPAERRKPLAPLPPRQPSAWHRERLKLLRAALAYEEMHPALVALTRLPVGALERAAAGRSTLGGGTWRRLAALLGIRAAE